MATSERFNLPSTSRWTATRPLGQPRRRTRSCGRSLVERQGSGSQFHHVRRPDDHRPCRHRRVRIGGRGTPGGHGCLRKRRSQLRQVHSLDRRHAGNQRRVRPTERRLSTVVGKRAILDRTSTTTCRGRMSGHRQEEPAWTSVRGAGVRAVGPAERGRSEATRRALTPVSTRARCCLDDAAGDHNILRSTEVQFLHHDQRRVMTSDRQWSAVAPGIAGVGGSASLT